MTTTPPLVELADGFTIHTPSEREARFIYNEIYADHCYDVPNLPSSPFIIDAGANIGLFTLYYKQKFPSATILAFEPAPQTYSTLLRNLRLHGLADDPRISTFRSGLGEREAAAATFTYYPNAPGNSTLFPDQKDGLKQLVASKFPEHGQQVIDAWLGKEEVVEVEVQRLSHFLLELESRKGRSEEEEQGGGLKVESIDLLKIDVEGAEFEVLAGLDEEHWPLVKNVVLEITTVGNEGAVERMRALLEQKGFVVTVEAAHPDWSEVIVLVKGTRA
ncbi:S-adenosyl-L-methionine-dependent methyltransferase [Chaetomium strumarium]|uniref:S-adenosyl-L-methionine-dependent methyltransferase n=1 Tax=Chaetomium strumarium TaxID=1170767 RepID=A0AAJ0M2A9_9PEZI|nr:S-adenosyl-L-methionine-dependent methyltransferase [Chaetomium strumarium]